MKNYLADFRLKMKTFSGRISRKKVRPFCQYFICGLTSLAWSLSFLLFRARIELNFIEFCQCRIARRPKWINTPRLGTTRTMASAAMANCNDKQTMLALQMIIGPLVPCEQFSGTKWKFPPFSYCFLPPRNDGLVPSSSLQEKRDFRFKSRSPVFVKALFDLHGESSLSLCVW